MSPSANHSRQTMAHTIPRIDGAMSSAHSRPAPSIASIGPASYVIAEVIVVLSEKYIEWKLRKSREALSGWLTRKADAWENGESFDEKLPKAVSWRHFDANMDLITASPKTLSEIRNRGKAYRSDITDRQRVLEMQAWYGRKRLAEDRGETFTEPFPSGNGAHRS